MSEIRQAIILGAGERKVFDRPVGFLEIEDTNLIERLISLLNSNGVDDITVVTGYKKEYYEELAKARGLNLIYNEKFKWTGTMTSLALAKEAIQGDFLLVESDIVFEERAIEALLKNDNANCILITNESGSGDEALVEIDSDTKCIKKMSKDIHQLNKVDGEFIGLSKISKETFNEMLADFKHNKNPFYNYEYALVGVANKCSIAYENIDDLVWAEIDNKEQLRHLNHIIYPKLQRKEMEIRNLYVNKLIAATLNIEQSSITNTERLGGLTNKNYKVESEAHKYVVRLAGNGTSQFINRENEKQNSSVAYKLGIDSETLYFDVNSGMKICKYIDEAETINPTTGKKEENMELMAGLLRTLHDSGESFNSDFDNFDITEFYERALIEAGGKVYDEYYELKEKFMPLKQELMELGFKKGPCHLDTLPENFIKSGEGRMYLIDWEYSGNYDVLFDVAAVCLECGYDEDERELFYEKYFGATPTDVDKRKIDIHTIMQDMFWSNWAAAKAAKGDEYLREYGLDRYNRGKANLIKYLEKRRG